MFGKDTNIKLEIQTLDLFLPSSYPDSQIHPYAITIVLLPFKLSPAELIEREEM